MLQLFVYVCVAIACINFLRIAVYGLPKKRK